MKNLCIILFLCAFTAMGQTKTYPLKEDVSTIAGLMKASYEVVSGPAGTARQWERDNSLHHPSAVYSFPSKDGKEQLTMSVKEFHSKSDAVAQTVGFYEIEINREVRQFGNMAHVWSTYETRHEPTGPIIARGINSVQLYNDGQRWWVVSWVYDRERPGQLIPPTFDPK